MVSGRAGGRGAGVHCRRGDCGRGRVAPGSAVTWCPTWPRRSGRSCCRPAIYQNYRSCHWSDRGILKHRNKDR